MKINLIILCSTIIFFNFIASNTKDQNSELSNLKKLDEIISKKESATAYVISNVFKFKMNTKAKNNFEKLQENKK